MATSRQIAIGCDHAGYEMKEMLKEFLQNQGIEIKDYGTDSPDSVDYPDFAHTVASAVEQGDHELGILICGSANGVAMAANKHKGVRAGIAWQADVAELARTHNDANILCLPSRFIGNDVARQCTRAWLEAEFEGGRHQRRVEKIGNN